MDLHNLCEAYELKVADRFFSWGWRSEAKTIVPLAPAFPERSRPERRGELLIVCVAVAKYLYRFWYQPMPGNMEEVNRETVDFARLVGGRYPIVVRLYPGADDWGLRAALEACEQGIGFDKAGSSPSRSYARARMVVHNYLGTAWLETLALGIPTICIFQPSIYSFRNDCKPFIERLMHVGILHESGRSAGEFVASLGSEIDAWWSKPDVLEARQSFVRNYANFSTNWKAHWEEEFGAWL